MPAHRHEHRRRAALANRASAARHREIADRVRPYSLGVAFGEQREDSQLFDESILEKRKQEKRNAANFGGFNTGKPWNGRFPNLVKGFGKWEHEQKHRRKEHAAKVRDAQSGKRRPARELPQSWQARIFRRQAWEREAFVGAAGNQAKADPIYMYFDPEKGLRRRAKPDYNVFYEWLPRLASNLAEMEGSNMHEILESGGTYIDLQGRAWSWTHHLDEHGKADHQVTIKQEDWWDLHRRRMWANDHNAVPWQEELEEEWLRMWDFQLMEDQDVPEQMQDSDDQRRLDQLAQQAQQYGGLRPCRIQAGYGASHISCDSTPTAEQKRKLTQAVRRGQVPTCGLDVRALGRKGVRRAVMPAPWVEESNMNLCAVTTPLQLVTQTLYGQVEEIKRLVGADWYSIPTYFAIQALLDSAWARLRASYTAPVWPTIQQIAEAEWEPIDGMSGEIYQVLYHGQKPIDPTEAEDIPF